MKAALLNAALAVRGARRLGGSSDLVVSEACLGTMTWGVQTDQRDAFLQLDHARDVGVNFIDTAELYPVPLTAPEWRPGTSEEILGNYLAQIGSAARDELVVATKISGYLPQSKIAAQRTVPPQTDPLPDSCLNAENVRAAVQASLRRLQTDRIDLMQLHWPDRYVPLFGQLEFDPDKIRDNEIPIHETAAALKEEIDKGTIRYIGLSNESPYGVCEWVKATEDLGIRDKLVSIQNSYCLLDRRFDSDMAELCARYNLGLMPWSVLAGGLLTGKYQTKTAEAGSRFVKYPEYMARWSPATASPQTLKAVEAYVKLAEESGMTPAQMAIAFVRSRRFVSEAGSVLIGATSVAQLKENLEPFEDENAKLDASMLESINKIHMNCRDPSCAL